MKAIIQDCYPVESRAVLRYQSAFPEMLRDRLQETSSGEGFRLVKLEPYRDVHLFLMDEASCMSTGTYKSLDGCVTIAMAKEKGLTRIVCSSGANAGRALTEYGRRAGIETFFFCPETTLFKLPAELFDSKSAHLVAVEGSDRRVKNAAQYFSERARTALVPEIEWRFLASGVRGMFVAECSTLMGAKFDWFAQAICAGFGPIGLYRSLQKIVNQGLLDRNYVPAFLGVQQSALAPIAEAWARGQQKLSEPACWNTDGVIEPSLYNTLPAQTYPMLQEILMQVGGDVMTVNPADYESLGPQYLNRLEAAGIRLTRKPNGEPMEKAGLLAGAGVLKAIDMGQIRKGQVVLCSLSGGMSSPPAAPAEPEFRIPLSMELETAMASYIKEQEVEYTLESIR